MAARVVGGAVAICLLVTPVAASGSRTVYVTDGALATPRVAALSVGAGGALSIVPNSPFTAPAATTPNGVALSTDGRFLYTANTGGATVNGFAVNPDGGLAGLTGSPFATGQSRGRVGGCGRPNWLRVQDAAGASPAPSRGWRSPPTARSPPCPPPRS